MWQKLGTTVHSADTHDDMLMRARANFEVNLIPVYVWDSLREEFVPIPNRFVTSTTMYDGGVWEQVNWEVMKDRYEVVQNRDILARADAILRELDEEGYINSVGTLDNGRKFFVVVNTGTMEIEVHNRIDHIDNYIVVMSSHDGSIPICYYPLDSRRVTQSVLRLDDFGDGSVRKRHTPQEDDLTAVAKEVLKLRDHTTTVLKDRMQTWLVNVTPFYIDHLLESLWPTTTAPTQKRKEFAESVHVKIKELYNSDHILGMYGTTKWSAYLAIMEYMDFHRNIDRLDAAQQSFEIDTYAYRFKATAATTIATQ